MRVWSLPLEALEESAQVLLGGIVTSAEMACAALRHQVYIRTAYLWYGIGLLDCSDGVKITLRIYATIFSCATAVRNSSFGYARKDMVLLYSRLHHGN